MDTTKEEWKTDNLGLAAFLVHVDHEILRREWQGVECWFIFQHTDELSDDVADFTGSAAEVDPERFLRTYNAVKREMLNERPVIEHQPKRNTQRAAS